MVQSRGLAVGVGVAVSALVLAACSGSKTDTSGIHDQSRDVAFTACGSQCAGSLNGAKYRIELPAKWNGTLLIYSHGYRYAAPAPPVTWKHPAWQLPAEGFSLDAHIDELVAHALAATDQNVSAAARRLGVTREFLRYRLARGESPAPPT